MNFKVIRYYLSRLILLEAVLMILPVFIGLIYKESFQLISSFLITMICIVIFFFLIKVKNIDSQKLHTKEGMVIVASTWFLWAIFGGLPFVISGQIPNFFDAVFEMSSGFTTTGASILTDVEALSHAHLFWRSFSHLIGGMGVLVFALAVTPKSSSETVHLMRAEVPGPSFDKLVSKIRQTAMILYAIYLVMTALTIILLLFGGMNLFDASCHAFGIAGTGGFSTYNDSIGHFNSPYIEWVTAIIMLCFGMNFNLFYMIIIGQVSNVLKNDELRLYLSVVGLSTAILFINNIYSSNYTISENLRHSFFAISSYITTSGFVTLDYSKWPLSSIMILAFVMFVGGMAGSTGGGFKVARFGVIRKAAKAEVESIKNPRRVSVIKFNGKAMTEKQVKGVVEYLILYVFTAGIIFFLVSFEPNIDLRTAFSAMMNTVNNIGAGFATESASASFANYSIFSKIVLTISMITGRLEIYPVLILFSPSTYLNRS